ncbi:adenylyltransferase/cytidyltransferase family protein [Butyrivibrio sp. AE3006]|uniref:adenylyltransferase/cytidyltransferase family protein n=1 Tax=Butyrivibrio sp. AE3006 TaxID=1280673 RepID=UPI00040AE279|nr:adenylyltransferase/cytidyltransferase family protein [Butyrivibrio sp. AE3006]
MTLLRWAMLEDDDIEFLKNQLSEMADYYERKGIHFICIKYPRLSEVMDIQQRKAFEWKLELPDSREDFMPIEEQKKFYGSLYRPGLAEEMVEARRGARWQRNNGILKYNDLETELVTIIDGHRVVPNAPKKSVSKVFLVGNCNIFGVYQDNSHTIGFYLQEKLNDRYGDNYEVIIASNMGVYEFSALNAEKMRKGDLVICQSPMVENINESDMPNIISVKEAFSSTPDLQNHLYNSLWHHDYVINKKVAEILFDSILKYTDNLYSTDEERVAKQDYYIPVEADRCYRYLKRAADMMAIPKNSNIGAIVMNCNPFTKGHRYLVEEALKRVDFLYVFVVQEDKSRFRFDDRLRMAREGLKDLADKVCVLKSGSFIISKETFEQYFDKEYDVDYVEDMEYDLRVFCEVVCKYFNIIVRFVGEEPFDKVTSKYNETMKKLLPEYGIEVVEIPRVKSNDNIVSATRVRAVLDNCFEELEALMPKEIVLDAVRSYGSSSDLSMPSEGQVDKDQYIEISRLCNADNLKVETLMKQFCRDDDYDIYIFGAGKWGKSLLEYLQDNKIKGFVVDDEYVPETKVSEEHTVIGFSKLNAGTDKVILATSRQAAYNQLLLWGGSFVRIPEAFIRKISGTERNE